MLIILGLFENRTCTSKLTQLFKKKRIHHNAYCTNGLESSENPTVFQGKRRVLEIQPYQQRIEVL